MTKFNDEIRTKVIRLRNKGYGESRMAKELGVSPTTASRWMKRCGVDSPIEARRDCNHCGRAFKTNSPSKKFCSQKCRNAFNKQNRGKKQTCKQCGKAFKRYTETECCSDECRAKHFGWYEKEEKPPVFYNKVCRECGKHFTTKLEHAKSCSEKCSTKYIQRLRYIKRRLRVKHNGEVHWDISIERLMKRDGKHCYICGREVRTDVDSNHNEYPSIEHVNPLSKGGTHTWDNVKLAHRLCNSIKRDRIIVR